MTKETFTELVLASEKTLYRVSMSMLKNETDCEDAVQTAILSAYQKLDTLKNEDFFKTWLVRILINVCNKQLNHNKRFIDIQEYMETAVPTYDINVDVKIALEQLPVKIREAVVLYYIEEFSVKEIKSILHIPEGTVKSRLSKGRELLKLVLE